MIKEFKKYLKKDGKSLTTIVSYVGAVDEYINWYENNYLLNFHYLKREDVTEFKSYLKNNKNYNEKTVNSKISAIAKFNEFLVHNNL